MARRLGKDTITVRRAPLLAADSHGIQRRDWAAAVEHDEARCYVEQGASEEYLLGGDTVTISWTVFAPLTADALVTDQVVWQGIEYEVYKEPKANRSISGKLDYLEILLWHSEER